MAVDEITSILQSQIGRSVGSIEKEIYKKIERFFYNKEALKSNIFSSSILSTYEYILKYTNDKTFYKGLKDVIKCYTDAYLQNPSKVAHIIFEGHELFSERENIMWTIRHSKIPECDDIYEQVISVFEYIGNVLEVSVKGIAYELYAMISVISGKEIDYSEICKYDFGVIINNILSKGYFGYILKTDDIELKLSDWRNIAKHNSFKVNNEKIECIYGKNVQYSFEIYYDDLLQYLHQIIRASNILNVARCIFVIDNMEIFQQFRNERRSPVRFRDCMLFNQLKISLMAYGLRLEDIYRDKGIIVMIVQDLKNNGHKNRNFLDVRQKYIHHHVKEMWVLLNAEKVQVEYFNKHNEIEDVLWIEPVKK